MSYGTLIYSYEWENEDGDVETIYDDIYTWIDDELVEICTSDYCNHSSHQHHEWDAVVVNVLNAQEIDLGDVTDVTWCSWEEDMHRKVA